MRAEQQAQLLRQQPMMAGQMGPYGPMRGMRNGMMPGDLQKTAMQNNVRMYVITFKDLFAIPMQRLWRAIRTQLHKR